MKYRLLVNTLLRVSEVVPSTITFDTETSGVLIKKPAKKCIGKVIKSERDYIVLGAKYTDAMPSKGPKIAS